MLNRINYRYWLLILPIVVACASSGVKKNDLYTLTIDEELEFGRNIAAEVRLQYKLLDHPEVNAYLNRIGKVIGQNSDWSGLNYTVHVIVSDEVYHFSLPGGYIYLTTGLIKEMVHVNEAAAILANEVANIVNRSASRQLVAKFGSSIFSQSVLGENPDIWREIVSDLFGDFSILRFSKNDNRAADRLSLIYLEKSKFDPTGLVLIYKTNYRVIIATPERAGKLLRTNPPDEDRIKQIEKRIARSSYDPSLVSTDPEFQNIKKIIIELK